METFMKIFRRVKALVKLHEIKSRQRAKVLVNQVCSQYRAAGTQKEKDRVVEQFVMSNF